MEIEIIPLQDAQLLVEINETGIPGVNHIHAIKAQWLIDHAAAALLAVSGGRPAGVLIALPEDCNFDSEYFRWFTARYTRIIYLDRVIVLDWARGRGVATRLYQAVDALAEQMGVAIVSEVYSLPPNPVSTRFHTRCGYRQVGSQDIVDEGKVVSKLIKFPERALVKSPPGFRPTLAQIFSYFRLGLVTGLISPTAVTGWVDQAIVAAVEPPPVEMIELSLAGSRPLSQMVGLLNHLQSSPGDAVPVRMVLARAGLLLEQNPGSATELARELTLLLAENRHPAGIQGVLTLLAADVEMVKTGALPESALRVRLDSLLAPYRDARYWLPV